MNEQIPFIDLHAQRDRIGPEIDAAIQAVLVHGQYVLGPEVDVLERELAARSGVERVITCASGTDALQLALMGWGIGPGDAVIVPAFTFVATAEVVALVGATPVFVDVCEADANLDASQIEPAVALASASGLRPRAVIAVGLYGQPCEEDAVAEAAVAARLHVLGDAAQSYGATYRGRDTGSFGEASIASFFPSKPLGCYGDGGAVFTNDAHLADRLVSLRMHGFGSDRYEHVRFGLTSRLDTIQAAVLLEKLKIFDDELEQRQRVASSYEATLEGVLEVPRLLPERTSAWAQYTVRVRDRNEVIRRLSGCGIPTAVHYPSPIHRQPAYAQFPVLGRSLPVAERLAETVLSVPMHPYLSAETQDFVSSALAEAVSSAS